MKGRIMERKEKRIKGKMMKKEVLPLGRALSFIKSRKGEEGGRFKT